MKLLDPVTVGVPDISPLEEFKVKPGGRFPEMMDQT